MPTRPAPKEGARSIREQQRGWHDALGCAAGALHAKTGRHMPTWEARRSGDLRAGPPPPNAHAARWLLTCHAYTTRQPLLPRDACRLFGQQPAPWAPPTAPWPQQVGEGCVAGHLSQREAARLRCTNLRRALAVATPRSLEPSAVRACWCGKSVAELLQSCPKEMLLQPAAPRGGGQPTTCEGLGRPDRQDFRVAGLCKCGRPRVAYGPQVRGRVRTRLRATAAPEWLAPPCGTWKPPAVQPCTQLHRGPGAQQYPGKGRAARRGRAAGRPRHQVQSGVQLPPTPLASHRPRRCGKYTRRRPSLMAVSKAATLHWPSIVTGPVRQTPSPRRASSGGGAAGHAAALAGNPRGTGTHRLPAARTHSLGHSLDSTCRQH